MRGTINKKQFLTILFTDGGEKMPQISRYTANMLPIEFNADEKFTDKPLSERLTMILITSGKASLILNKKTMMLAAPCMLLISQYDQLKLGECSRFAAKSFSFAPPFLNSNVTFEGLKSDDISSVNESHDRSIMGLFLIRDEYYDGAIDLPLSTYLHISQWLAIIGTEVYSQSDGYWPCRIRRYLLQTLYLLQDIFFSREIPGTINRKKSQIDIVLEYIHVNYADDITLDTLCQLIHLNRTSLNQKFKEQTGQTPINYLLSYRLKIACETLKYTSLGLSEITEALGFRYDTYFIRQFTEKMGVSPTEYRRIVQAEDDIKLMG